ncbi:MAG: hypothetical protein WA843_01665 [Candidatus Saccharimonadales bacterium]
MSEILTIVTEKPNILLREWSNKADDIAYFEAIDEDRVHLSQHNDVMARKYPNIEAVKERRLNPGKHIRLGIWDEIVLKVA